jgi:DNA adenine methylase
MKYMGSKRKIADNILPIILKNRNDRLYIEPFCGGCNSLCKVSGKRLAADINPYLIAMWQGIQKGNLYPKIIEKEFYSDVRNSYNKKDGRYTNDIIGWVGFMASFNGRFFDGGYSGHNVNGRNYIEEQIRNTLSQQELLKDVMFICSSYNNLSIPNNSIVYCDPPYKNTKQYGISKNFNYDEFWDWVRKIAQNGNDVFVSEYNAPDDFKCVWQKEVTNSLNPLLTKKPVEKLFVYDRRK